VAGNFKPGDLVPASVTSPAPLDQLALQDQLDERRSNRSFKYYVGRVIVTSIAVCFVATVLTMVYGYVFKGVAMQGTVIEAFLKTFTDILRILFTPQGVAGP
jgi:hypothetical protein